MLKSAKAIRNVKSINNSVNVMYILSPPLVMSRGGKKDLPSLRKEGKATATVVVFLRDSRESFFILSHNTRFVNFFLG